jgi:hypothetical protein
MKIIAKTTEQKVALQNFKTQDKILFIFQATVFIL